MTKRSQEIRNFIIRNVGKFPNDITEKTSEEFSISRQAVNRHLNRLIDEKVLDAEGATRNRSYQIRNLERWEVQYSIDSQLAEDVVWRDDIKSLLKAVPDNVLGMWDYGFTEIFNNAIEHSEGSEISVKFKKNAADVEIHVKDDGVGIFEKVKNNFILLDERHAVLELSKGKLTTDPENHTGQGIFFTSRMFDKFTILSGETFFYHKYGTSEDWVVESSSFESGTVVSMQLNNQVSRTVKEVFDRYTSGEDYAFSKTVVPVRLAQYERENLISRSQAKRLMTRLDSFNTVVLDFDNVEVVGQAFADEAFRVFPAKHPDIEVIPANANKAVMQMISRAKS